MIYFSLNEIFKAVFAFIILGLVSSFFYFFLTLLKKESRLTFLSLKKLLLSSPREIRSCAYEYKPSLQPPPGHFFDFCFTLFIGILYILFSYVFADGLFRLAYLLVFSISFVFTNKLLSKIEEPLALRLSKLVTKFLYVLLVILYPVRCIAFAAFKLLFGIIRKLTAFICNILKKC